MSENNFKELSALGEAAMKDNRFSDAYSYYEQALALEVSQDAALNRDICGYCCGKLDFDDKFLDEISALPPESQNKYLNLLLNIAENHKFSQLDSLRGKIGRKNSSAVFEASYANDEIINKIRLRLNECEKSTQHTDSQKSKKRSHPSAIIIILLSVLVFAFITAAVIYLVTRTI